MTTYIQDKEFKDQLISDDILIKVIEWINKNMEPDEVFEKSKLSYWATYNDWVKEEEMDRIVEGIEKQYENCKCKL